MDSPPPASLKKALIAEGFQVYRTLADRVVLAERVRENLIMDSGVTVHTGDTLRVRVSTRAQARDFPGHSEADLLERARAQGQPALEAGYEEVGAAANPVTDPTNPAEILDVWYEVSFVKTVSFEDLAAELRWALLLEKVVGGRH